MWYILRAINNYNNGDNQLVKKTNLSKTFHVVSKATNDFLQEFERTPTPEELLDIITTKYKKDIKDKNDLLDLKISYVDETNGDDSDTVTVNYGDITAYNRASASYNAYEAVETNDFNKALVTSLLSTLTPRKQQIIKMRFGMYEESKGLVREYEREEIADKLGLTSERVRQLENEAMEEIRKEYVSRMGKLK
jgi:RNA polymerase primary sigma factor